MSNLPTPSDDEDPLTLTSYLLSPVEAIVHSTQAVAPDSLSLHDILEAYHILSTRIRRLSSDLEAAPIPITALAPLQTNCASIVVALRRDVSRALRVHVQRDSYECGARFSVAAEGSICVGAACNPKCASESSLLCLYALRLLSEVFRLPPLSSLFSEGDLGLLLDDVLMITRSQLPSFNAPKISAVAGWILRTQQLPQSVLVLRIKDICSYLETILDDNRQETHDHVAIVDALECIVSLMTRHGPISVADTTELLPFVLPLIMHSSPELRHHVAIVLAAFSRTITMHRTVVSQKTIDTIAFHTNAFLVPETTRRPASSRKLALLLDEAVISKHLDDVGCNTPWALTVTASFTIMLGASLFASPGPLKLLLTTTHKAKGRPLGQALHPHVWRTFIWSMSQLRAQQKPFTEASVDIFQRSVRVLKQALGNGLGGALVSSLLGASPSLAGGSRRWIIPSTIDVVRDMLSSQSAIVREDGLRLLVCITCKVATSVGDVPSASWSEDSLLSQFLLDGSLLRADKSRVEELAGLASFFPPRCLSEEEVLLHWEVVFECLVLVVQNHFNYGGVDLACAALSVWQSLLLVKAHLDQDLNNLAEFSLQLPNLLSGFLPGPTIMLSGEADSLELQIRALSVLTQLWAAVQSIFSQAWLVAVASSLLASVSRRAFHLSNEDVLKNWSSLCSALIAAGVNVLELISAQDDSQDTLEFKRQLWRLTATSWKESQFSNLQNTVSFLVLPMSSWEMSTEELDVWEQVFERGASSAAVISVKMVDVIEGISSQLLIVLSSLSISTALRLAVAMLRHLELDGKVSVPVNVLTYLSSALMASYSRQPHPDALDAVFEALGVLHNVMISLPALLFEPAVLHLQAGLAVWIEDKHALVSDSEYNADLAPLYISILKRLQDVSPSVASLNAMAPLLTSAFSHIPHPAKGPFAFQEFFSAAYKRLALPANAYRDDLRTCVQACVRIHDGKLPVGMEPLSSSSQTQTQFHNGGAHLSIQAVTPPVSGNNARTQDLDTPSMECGIFPDSLFGTLAAAVPPPRSIPEFIQGSTWQRLQPAGSPKVVAVPQLEDDSPVNGDVQRKLTEPSRSTINPKKRSASDNASAAKRRCSSSSHELHTRSAPLTRTSSPVDSNWRSHSTQKAVPRSKMVMDCVELVPLREILRRRKAQPKRADERMQPTPYEDYESWEVTPDTPFVRRTIRELLAGDEIVPETPDVYQRSGQTSPPARRVPDLHEGPLRPPALPQPLTRAATPSSRFTAVMNEVQDVFLQAGVSQLPTHELATSVRLFEAASKNVLRALAKNAGASDAGPTCEQAPVRHGSC